MAKLGTLTIDLSKIDKAKIIRTNKDGEPLKDGKQLYEITFEIRDEKNKWGQDVSAWQPQTKEQRDAKEERHFIGNGKILWSSDGAHKQQASEQSGGVAQTDVSQKSVDDLPF